MLVCKQKNLNKVAILFSSVLIIAGVNLRSLSTINSSAPVVDMDTKIGFKMVHFLNDNNLTDVTWVHYTNDSGIRGLQLKLPKCAGYLQLAIMPEGDEFLSLWQARSTASVQQNSYLFNHQLYPDFPVIDFWWQTMTYSLAHKLNVSGLDKPGVVIAMAYPPPCQILKEVPWQHFNAHGDDS
ncbi:MAG: hypothetical protein RPT25_07710 [Cycloclasticus sp.]